MVSNRSQHSDKNVEPGRSFKNVSTLWMDPNVSGSVDCK
jgi:hypothetical protein